MRADGTPGPPVYPDIFCPVCNSLLHDSAYCSWTCHRIALNAHIPQPVRNVLIRRRINGHRYHQRIERELNARYNLASR